MPCASSSWPLHERRFAAALFDLDSTLIDSKVVVERSWLTWAREFAVEPARLASYHGVPAAPVVADLVAAEHREAALARVTQLELTDTDDVAVLPGAAEALASLLDGGIPVAIVTSCTRDLAEVRLAATGLRRPHALVPADAVAHGKPAPDPYLAGARALGVDPADCLVVEDSVAGLTSARAANCGGTLAVLTTSSVDALAPVADAVVQSLADVGFTLDEYGSFTVDPR